MNFDRFYYTEGEQPLDRLVDDGGFACIFRTIGIVGDSLSSDIMGGINAGIKTCHFNPTDKPYGGIKPDYKIKNLSELIDLLDNIG